MKVRRTKRLVITSISIIFFVVIVVYGAMYLTPEPPSLELNRASAAISAAKIVAMDIQSRKLLNQAEVDYDSAIIHWKRENTRWILLRDYDNARAFALDAESRAQKAHYNGIKDKSNVQLQLALAIDSINKSIEYYRPFWKSLPVQGPENKRYEKALMLFAEARLAYENLDYHTSQTKLDEASKDMSDATQILEATLKNYFQQFPVWQAMANKTIKNSKSDRAILIDKFAAKCHLYMRGKLTKTYDVELGINWIGDKRKEGDKATPEGHYKITRKKKGKETIYHKALLLNYPNDQDKERFANEIKNGSLPKASRIGGLIEIHGGGGRGAHWTDGCIAIADDQMDLIYDFVSVNTPVTIVGSMSTLEEIKKSMQQ